MAHCSKSLRTISTFSCDMTSAMTEMNACRFPVSARGARFSCIARALRPGNRRQRPERLLGLLGCHAGLLLPASNVLPMRQPESAAAHPHCRVRHPQSSRDVAATVPFGAHDARAKSTKAALQLEAGDGDRTRTKSLEGSCAAITPRPRVPSGSHDPSHRLGFWTIIWSSCSSVIPRCLSSGMIRSKRNVIDQSGTSFALRYSWTSGANQSIVEQ